MSVITSTRPAAVPGAPTRPPGRRFSPATPVSYLVGVIIIVVSAVPLLFVVINGFRTKAQINNSATGLLLYLLLQRVGLLDNPIGLALPQAAFSLPFTIVSSRPQAAAAGKVLSRAACHPASTWPR